MLLFYWFTKTYKHCILRFSFFIRLHHMEWNGVARHIPFKDISKAITNLVFTALSSNLLIKTVQKLNVSSRI